VRVDVWAIAVYGDRCGISADPENSQKFFDTVHYGRVVNTNSRVPRLYFRRAKVQTLRWASLRM